jgi:hypothetical protein
MNRLIKWLSIIFLFLSLMPITAQEEQTNPLLFTAKGTIYAWKNGITTQLTSHNGYSYSPVISPDGTQFAYRAWSQMTVDYSNKRESFEWRGQLPTDIMIYDFTTRESVAITSQPDFANSDNLENGVRHSAPQWSPDGTMLTWLASMPNNDDSMTFELVVYDVVTATSTTIATDLLSEPFADEPFEVYWGENGIYTSYVQYAENDIIQETYFLFSPTGETRYEVTFMTPIGEFPSFTSFVAQDGEREVFTIYYDNEMMRLIDETGNVEEIMGGIPQKYNQNTPDGIANIIVSFIEERFSFYITNPNSQIQELLAEDQFMSLGLDIIQVAPDGISMALLMLGDGKITIWNNAEITIIERPIDDNGNKNHISGITWGNQGIRILRG